MGHYSTFTVVQGHFYLVALGRHLTLGAHGSQYRVLMRIRKKSKIIMWTKNLKQKA
jgi:hypothetical protein